MCVSGARAIGLALGSASVNVGGRGERRGVGGGEGSRKPPSAAEAMMTGSRVDQRHGFRRPP